MSGCSLECWKDVVQKACCPGYWGSQCYGTEVGGPSPAPHAPTCQHAPSSGSFNVQLGHLTLAAQGRDHIWGCPELLGLGEPGVLGADLSSVVGGLQSALAVPRPHAAAMGPAWMA